MRLILTCPMLLFILIVPCIAQSDVCTLKTEESPEVRGFKLGQAYEAVKKEVPDLEIVGRGLWDRAEKDELGRRELDLSQMVRYAQIDPRAPQDWVKRFEGVEGVKLIFLDDKLASIEIVYDSSTRWSDPLEFTAAIAAKLKLPSKGWRGREPTSLRCSGFIVETTGGMYAPQLTIKLSELDGELVTRKYENERKKKEKFKP